MIGHYVNKSVPIKDKYKFISFLGVRELPVKDGEKLYSKSELAFHEEKEIVQVYVTSPTKEGVREFFADYPNAKLIRTAKLENLKEWRILAYPYANVPDEAPPLDNYLVGLHENLLETLDSLDKENVNE